MGLPPKSAASGQPTNSPGRIRAERAGRCIARSAPPHTWGMVEHLERFLLALPLENITAGVVRGDRGAGTPRVEHGDVHRRGGPGARAGRGERCRPGRRD